MAIEFSQDLDNLTYRAIITDEHGNETTEGVEIPYWQSSNPNLMSVISNGLEVTLGHAVRTGTGTCQLSFHCQLNGTVVNHTADVNVTAGSGISVEFQPV